MICIQKYYRRWKLRKTLSEEQKMVKAVICIQKYYRRWKLRKTLSEEQKMVKAVICIQKYYRRWKLRKTLSEKKKKIPALKNSEKQLSYSTKNLIRKKVKNEKNANLIKKNGKTLEKIQQPLNFVENPRNMSLSVRLKKNSSIFDSNNPKPFTPFSSFP